MRIGLSLLLFVASIPSAARASEPCTRDCSCVQWTMPWPQTWPAPGAIDVPTNGRIFVSQPFAPEGFVLHAAGDPSAVVAIAVETVEGFDAVWVVPQAELAPNSNYELENDFFAIAVPFTTGAGRDDQAPPRLFPSAASLEDGIACDALAGTLITLETDEDLLVELIIDMAGTPRRLLIPSTQFEAGVVIGGMLGTESVCDEDLPDSFVETLPGAAADARITMMFRFIDLAGQTSDPVALSSILLDRAEPGSTVQTGACGPCGCRTVGAGSRDTPWIVLALGVFLLRRRR